MEWGRGRLYGSTVILDLGADFEMHWQLHDILKPLCRLPDMPKKPWLWQELSRHFVDNPRGFWILMLKHISDDQQHVMIVVSFGRRFWWLIAVLLNVIEYEDDGGEQS